MPCDQIGRWRAARGDELRLMDPLTPPAPSRWSLCAEAGWLSPFGGTIDSWAKSVSGCRRLQARPADSRRTAAQGKPTPPSVSSTSWGSHAAYWVALICCGTAGASLPVSADCMACETGAVQPQGTQHGHRSVPLLRMDSRLAHCGRTSSPRPWYRLRRSPACAGAMANGSLVVGDCLVAYLALMAHADGHRWF